jgi:predicted nucleic acid-binding protein
LILADTSAWAEFFRATGSSAHLTVRRLLQRRAPLVTSEVVIMELLAGARPGMERARLRGLLVGLPVLTLRGLADFEEAALIYRTCRAAGETIRSLTDCLIAVPAIKAGASILHNDADFDAIARHTPLQIQRP